MPLDVDAVVAKDCLEELENIMSDLPHMGRGDFCDDLEKFTEQMKKKYKEE